MIIKIIHLNIFSFLCSENTRSVKSGKKYKVIGKMRQIHAGTTNMACKITQQKSICVQKSKKAVSTSLIYHCVFLKKK